MRLYRRALNALTEWCVPARSLCATCRGRRCNLTGQPFTHRYTDSELDDLLDRSYR